MTALMEAAIHNKVEVAKLLVDSKADIDLKNRLDSTALMLAAREGSREIFDLLLDAGADAHCLYALLRPPIGRLFRI